MQRGRAHGGGGAGLGGGEGFGGGGGLYGGDGLRGGGVTRGGGAAASARRELRSQAVAYACGAACLQCRPGRPYKCSLPHEVDGQFLCE